MTQNLYNIVKYILIKYKHIDFLRLNFFLYYCQGWYLALYGKELFEEEFIAGIFGPYIEDLLKWCKRCPEHDYDNFNVRSEIKCEMKCSSTITEEEIKFIEEVLEIYDKYYNSQLTNLIRHQFPYKKARKGLTQAQKCNKTIDVEDMKKFFSFQLEVPNWITVKEKFKDFWIVLKLWIKHLLHSK